MMNIIAVFNDGTTNFPGRPLLGLIHSPPNLLIRKYYGYCRYEIAFRLRKVLEQLSIQTRLRNRHNSSGLQAMIYKILEYAAVAKFGEGRKISDSCTMYPSAYFSFQEWFEFESTRTKEIAFFPIQQSQISCKCKA